MEWVNIPSNKMIESWVLWFVIGIVVFLLAILFHGTFVFKNQSYIPSKPFMVQVSANSLLADLDQFYNTHLCSNLPLEFKRTLNRIMIYDLHQFKISKQDRSIFTALQIEILTKQVCSSLLVSNSSIMSSIQSFYQMYGSNGIIFDSHLIQQSDNQYLPVPNYLNVPTTNGVYDRIVDLVYRLNINVDRLINVLQPFMNSNTFPTINALLPNDYSYVQSTTSSATLPLSIYVKDFLYSLMYMFDPSFSMPNWTSVQFVLFGVQAYKNLNVFYNSLNCTNLTSYHKYVLNRIIIHDIIAKTRDNTNPIYQFINRKNGQFVFDILLLTCSIPQSNVQSQIADLQTNLTRLMNYFPYWELVLFSDCNSICANDMVSHFSNTLVSSFNNQTMELNTSLCYDVQEFLTAPVNTLQSLQNISLSFLDTLLMNCALIAQKYAKIKTDEFYYLVMSDLFYGFLIILNPDFGIQPNQYNSTLQNATNKINGQVCKSIPIETLEINGLIQTFCGANTIPCDSVPKPSACGDNNYSICSSKPRICGAKSSISFLKQQWGAAKYYCADTNRISDTYKNLANTLYGIDSTKLGQVCKFVSNPNLNDDQKMSIIDTVFTQMKC